MKWIKDIMYTEINIFILISVEFLYDDTNIRIAISEPLSFYLFLSPSDSLSLSLSLTLALSISLSLSPSFSHFLSLYSHLSLSWNMLLHFSLSLLSFNKDLCLTFSQHSTSHLASVHRRLTCTILVAQLFIISNCDMNTLADNHMKR